MAKYIALPHGVTEQVFDQAIAEYRAILGEDHVLTAADQLAPYCRIMLAAPEEEHYPSAAITPQSVEDIQKCLVVCNKYKVPVWPISTGRNFGYGSAAPGSRGQVVMDLRLMNRILDVDAELCTALVEPGVTYQQLYDYIQERNLPVWLSVPAPGAIAGPVGNTLERGNGYTPFGEHFMMQCGMEVVMANGDVLRTGMGAIPNSNTWQVFKWGYGPVLDGIFSQSNYGIVTKLGFWLMPAPPAYKPFIIRYEEDGDIALAIETLRPLKTTGVIPNGAAICSAMVEAVGIIKRADYYTDTYKGKGVMPQEIIEKIKKEHDLHAWTVYGALYGTDESIALNWKAVQEALKASGKGTLISFEELGPDFKFKYLADLMKGKPNLGEFGRLNYTGGGGLMPFSPVCQARGSESVKQIQMGRRIMTKWGFDYHGEFVIGRSDMHHIIGVEYDRSDAEEMKRAHACFNELLEEFSAAGYGTYRVNTAFMDKTAELYGPVKRDIDQKIKRALDPNGIIAPGKSGIWI
jgi:4-cresol dehydrogenase (hydroxylating)